MNIKQYLPIDEGVTHINIYSKSKLELGKLLSNFAKTPFTHPVYGEFASVEAFWYWLSTGKKHDSLKKLYGYKAKVEGKTFERVTVDNFKEELNDNIVECSKVFNYYFYLCNEVLKENKEEANKYIDLLLKYNENYYVVRKAREIREKNSHNFNL